MPPDPVWRFKRTGAKDIKHLLRTSLNLNSICGRYGTTTFPGNWESDEEELSKRKECKSCVRKSIL